jgi:23S rRNA (uridine2552-2'-O)-methyltransferase
MTFKVKDFYFNKAKKENFLARSIYKLEEIDERYKILSPNDRVIDMGYHPGSWVQYTSNKIGKNGLVVGIDIKPVNRKLMHLPNVRLLELDVFNVSGPEEVGESGFFDVALSDMAPNTTGVRSLDQDRSLNLIEQVFGILPKLLRPKGHMVLKAFEGHELQVFLKAQKSLFSEFHYLRPKSTRSVSKEFFIIGKEFKGAGKES